MSEPQSEIAIGTPAQSTPMVTQPAFPDEKSGARAFSCADAGAITAPAHSKPAVAAANKQGDATLANSDMAIPPSRLSVVRLECGHADSS